MSYGEILLALDMLPLAYDREIKCLVFFYKAVYGYIDIDLSNYVTFNNHPRARRGQSAGCYLTVPACKTRTLQASYFVRIVKLWNNLCNEALPSGFTSLRACLHGGGRSQIGEVTCGGSPHLSCERDQIKMRDYMDRRATPPTWGPSPPCKQALSCFQLFLKNLHNSLLMNVFDVDMVCSWSISRANL